MLSLMGCSPRFDPYMCKCICWYPKPEGSCLQDDETAAIRTVNSGQEKKNSGD